MALDLNNCFDGVVGFSLAVVLVQIKAKGTIANIAGILGLKSVGQIGLHPRPLVHDKAVVRVKIDPLLQNRFGELDLAAADAVNVDDDWEEEWRIVWAHRIGPTDPSTFGETGYNIRYVREPPGNRIFETPQRGDPDRAGNLVGMVIKCREQVGRWVAITEIIMPSRLAPVGMGKHPAKKVEIAAIDHTP